MSDELVPWTAAWLREYARLKGAKSAPSELVPLAKLVPLVCPKSSPKKLIWLERQNHRCCWCGKRCLLRDASWEHIIPSSLGGLTEDANLAVAHILCNRERKADMTWTPHPDPVFDFVRAVLAAYKPARRIAYKVVANRVVRDDSIAFWKQQT